MKDYNDASLLAREAARTYCAAKNADISPPHLANVVKHAGGDAEAIRAGIKAYFAGGGDAQFDEAALLTRFDQFYAESEEIIPKVAQAFADQVRRRVMLRERSSGPHHNHHHHTHIHTPLLPPPPPPSPSPPSPSPPSPSPPRTRAMWRMCRPDVLSHALLCHTTRVRTGKGCLRHTWRGVAAACRQCRASASTCWHGLLTRNN